jgi:putative aminopeptidase FrvX
MRWSRRSLLAVAVLAASPGIARAQALDSLAVRLGAMSAVTGMEDAMADTLLTMLPGAVRDRAGNVVWSRGSGAPVRLAVCGMDEIGYVVGNVTAEGYLTLRRVGTSNSLGALYDQFLEGQRVTVFGRSGPVPGVVGVRSTHLTRGRPADGDPAFSLDNAYVDVGASSVAEAQGAGITVLAPVTRAKSVHRYGPGGNLVAAPWMAQRAGCAALLSAALQSHPTTGTTIVAFSARWNFSRDGLTFLTSANPGATITVVGGYQPGIAMGATPPNLELQTPRPGERFFDLPARYPRTPVETVALSDVRALEAVLVSWLNGGPP